MFERVLVPLDGSRLAELVLPAVAELGRAFGPNVVLIGIFGPENGEDEQSCRRYLDSKAEELKASLAGSHGTLKTVAKRGNAAAQILEYAETGEFDLIVMSAQGSSCTMGRSLGGTVDKVLRGVGTPLIILRTKEPPGERSVFSRIVVPLDCSETSTAVLPHVERVARVLPSEVILVRVVEPGIHVRTIGGLQYVPFREQDRDLARAAASECLTREASRLAPVRGKVTCEVRAGDAAQEILALADEKGATLIAMSSHGHSRVRTWTMGSVVSRIVQAGTQSVWLVPTLARE